MFLVVVDAHSKWPEVVPVSSTTSSSTIEVLRDLFARLGIPEQIVSDNGAQFVSEEFQAFVGSNGIRHITSAPHHPATNGLAERAVQTFKQALRSMDQSSKPVKEKLAKFLIAYRNTPQSTTGVSPAGWWLCDVTRLSRGSEVAFRADCQEDRSADVRGAGGTWD